MRPRQAGLAIGIVHMALVGSVGLKLMADRARLPRGWVRTAPYDPELPIRGRYVRLRLEVPLTGAPDSSDTRHGVRLGVVDGRLVGTIDDSLDEPRGRVEVRDGRVLGVLDRPVAYFISEAVSDPSIRPAGEQLWAEVTVPYRGPPRPIRLGVLKSGTLTPLEPR